MNFPELKIVIKNFSCQDFREVYTICKIKKMALYHRRHNKLNLTKDDS